MDYNLGTLIIKQPVTQQHPGNLWLYKHDKHPITKAKPETFQHLHGVSHLPTHKHMLMHVCIYYNKLVKGSIPLVQRRLC